MHPPRSKNPASALFRPRAGAADGTLPAIETLRALLLGDRRQEGAVGGIIAADLVEITPEADGQSGQKAAPSAVLSTQVGRTTGAPITSACVCMR